MCRLEPIGRLQGGGSGKWPGARKSRGGEKEECQEWPGATSPCSTPASLSQPLRLPFQPAVPCLPRDISLKEKRQTSSLSLVHDGVLMAGIDRAVVVGTARGPVCPPCVFSQRAKGPPLRDAKVEVTAPNLDPSDLFLPIRLFSPVSRPSSDANHNSWLPEQMTAQVCQGRPKLSCACSYGQTGSWRPLGVLAFCKLSLSPELGVQRAATTVPLCSSDTPSPRLTLVSQPSSLFIPVPHPCPLLPTTGEKG